MAQEGFKRKLTAIISADVVGYSRMIDDDEEATIRTLTAYRLTMSSLVRKYRGRVVDATGDNLMAEFTSAVDAVKCAVEIQREFAERNAELADNRKMRFRIGVNVGDVVEEEDRIYGDGVNIAARVEGLAEAGGICISGRTYDQIENKLDLEYEFLGEKEVKNIAKPLRVYRLKMEPNSAVFEVSSTFKLPDKPSVAVLPFVNMSGDPEQEYFSDGITEDLITDLSKISGLFVIARQSVFTYKGKSIRLEQVGRELGVRHVLEGSVRKAGNRVRITAQLVDTHTGGHLWAERYDRVLEDIFALQDEVTHKIVESLAVRLTKTDENRLARKYTDNLAAYDLVLRGLEFYFRLNQKDNIQARQIFQKVIAFEPQYALAHSRLGWTYLREWSLGWSNSTGSLERSSELAKAAIALDDFLSDAHALLAETYLWKKQHDDAIAEAEKAISLDPNNAERMVDLGHVLTWAERPEEAIGWIKKAIRLNPICPHGYLFMLGHAYFLLERYSKAIATLSKSIERQPDFFPSRLVLIGCFWRRGQEDKFLAEIKGLQKQGPIIIPEAWKQLPYKDQRRRGPLERLIDALSDARLSD